MKWRKPPFSACTGSQAIRCGVRVTGVPASVTIRTDSGVTVATSPSSRNRKSRVCGSSAGMSEAT